MVAAAAARRLQRGQGSLQPASEALQRGGSLQLERAASATEQLFHVQVRQLEFLGRHGVRYLNCQKWSLP